MKGRFTITLDIEAPTPEDAEGFAKSIFKKEQPLVYAEARYACTVWGIKVEDVTMAKEGEVK